MKNNYISLIIALGLFFTTTMDAQFTDVINNGVVYEFQVQDNYYDGEGDTFDAADPTIENDFWLSSYGWVGWQCYTWDCDEPCHNYDNPTGVAGGANFDDEFQITIRAFESDNSDECTYTSGDDDFYNSNATLRDGSIQMRLIYPSSDFRPCQWNPWLASGTGWLFPESSVWDQIWKMTWRYAAGDNSRDPLNFGTVRPGDSKSDINATTSVTGQWSNMELNYTSQTNQPSPDVWYQFTTEEPTVVTISTANGITDFDTYLWLYTVDGGYVAENNNAAGTNKSTIQVSLNPDTYLIGVEGSGNNTGVFQLNLQVNMSTSTDSELAAKAVNIFPNPSNGVVNVDLSQTSHFENSDFEVYDQFNRKVHTQVTDQGLTELDLSHLPSGVYSLRVSGEVNQHLEHIIIQK